MPDRGLAQKPQDRHMECPYECHYSLTYGLHMDASDFAAEVPVGIGVF
jgi:hypothetical protein